MTMYYVLCIVMYFSFTYITYYVITVFAIIVYICSTAWSRVYVGWWHVVRYHQIPLNIAWEISCMIYFVAFGCHIDRFDQSNLQQLTEGTYLWSLWSYLVRHTRATCQHSEFQDIQKQEQCSMAFLGLSLRYVFRSFIKWRFTSKWNVEPIHGSHFYGWMTCI